MIERVIQRVTATLPALVVLLALVLGLRRLDNTDTWWHLAAGRYIVAHRTVPRTDVLSWTVRDHPWVNVQWLFDVVIYGIYGLWGASGLVVSAACAYASATALLLVNLRRHLGPVVASALATWAIVISQERFAIRPEMASYLLLQVMIWLYATGRAPGRRRLWFLPLVTCLWANCHSFFILGAIIVACQIVGSHVTDLPILPLGWRRPIEPEVRKRVVATGVAALAATVINPFGVTGAVFPLVLMSRINGNYSFFGTIGELKRPFEGFFVTSSVRAYQAFLFFAIAVVVRALMVSATSRPTGGRRAEKLARRAGRRRRSEAAPASPPGEEDPRGPGHLDLADVAVLGGTAYLSVLARRNMALLAMGGGPTVAACLAVLGSRLRGVARSVATHVERALGLILIPGLLGAGCLVVTNDFYHRNNELHEFGVGRLDVMFPERAAEFMGAQGLPGPMFNDWTDGAYLSWAAPIPGGVYVDGRSEVYDVSFLAPYFQQLKDPTAWQAEMDRRGVQTAVLFHWWPNHQALLHHLVTDRRWAVVYYDETSVVAVRRDGNEEVVARAAAAFPAEREATERMLLETPSSWKWQWQVGRIRGLETYGSLLASMGKPVEAARFQQRLAELRKPPWT